MTITIKKITILKRMFENLYVTTLCVAGKIFVYYEIGR